MKTVHTALIVVLALGLFARPGVTQTTPQQQGQPLQKEVPQVDLIAKNEQPAQTIQPPAWATPTVVVNSTPTRIQEKPSRKRQRVESEAHRPSKGDWIRCLQNDGCHPRNLYSDQWDRVFRGPVNVFIGD